MTARALSRIRRVARTAGLVPALSALCAETLPGLLPCGPAGHAIVPADVAASADRVWLAGVVSPRSPGTEKTLSTVELDDGVLVVLRHQPAVRPSVHGSAWEAGLVVLRLGLSERLLDTCVRYLGDRTTGESTLLRQQLVQGAVADVLIEHLEVRAVLADEASDPAHLQDQITRADRVLLRLLGAGGFLAGGPGTTAHLSELLAEAHRRPEEGA
jgi:hypothetical protein